MLGRSIRITLCLISLQAPVYGHSAPEDILSPAEIAKIKESKNYFFRDILGNDEPIWNHSERRYSSVYLKDRKDLYSKDDILTQVLKNGLPMRYKVEELYRASLSRHIAWGSILPRLSLKVGEGMSPISPAGAFKGLFGFLQPQNWLSLAKAEKSYKSTQFLFLKAALDEYYNSETHFLKIHSTIQDLEILNFFATHLELLSREFPESAPAVITVKGKIATTFTDMALKRSDLRLQFDQLASTMALAKDRSGHSGASLLNIKNIGNFPAGVHALEEIAGQFPDKDKFVDEVLKRSVELRAVKELVTVARLDVGVTALGDMVGSGDDSAHPTDVRIGLSFGFDTIPRILSAQSRNRTAKIDVESELIKLITLARNAHDAYTNSLDLYQEAKVSLHANRLALKVNLDRIFNDHAVPDPLLNASIFQLLDAEFRMNAALHNSLLAMAAMKRLLVTQEENIASYMPDSRTVRNAMKVFASEYEDVMPDEMYLDDLCRTIRRGRDLAKLLSGQWQEKRKDVESVRSFTPLALRDALSRNMDHLLSSASGRKSTRFYKALRKYVEEHDVDILPVQKQLLVKKSSLLSRLRR